MNIFYTNDFFIQATRLIKKSKDGYQSCLEDTISVISNTSLNNIRTNNIVLTEQKPIHLLKIRLPNSYQKLSKRDGFRLIAVADTENESLSLLYVFPKTGKYGQGNISKKEEIHLLNNYISEVETASLKSFTYKLPDFLKLFQRSGGR